MAQNRKDLRGQGYRPAAGRQDVAADRFTPASFRRSVLSKIRFHGRDYEECRLLGYKNPVRTPQKTHYFSATESSQLMLCKI
jgi:hypothetical protein